MRDLQMWAQLALAAAGAVDTIEVPRSENGFVSMPISYKSHDRPLMKRDEDNNVPLFNISVLSYLIELTIGTPGQPVKVAIDTGSSELWVNPNCKTSQSTAQYQECLTNGEYDPDQSSTSTDLNSMNTIPYGIGTVEIEYYKDNVALPNSTIKLKDIQVGAASRSQDLNEGILGLSFGGKAPTADLRYNNFVDELVLQNVTDSRTFSVALGNQDASNGGVIIFGGIDTGKFTGKMTTVPVLGPQGGENLYRVRRYWVQLKSIGSTMGGSSKKYDNSATAIVIDTGSSLSTLPSGVVSSMVRDLNGQTDRQGNVIVPCPSSSTTDNTFDFDFGAVPIRIPYRNFVIEAGPRTCILGVQAATSGGVMLLGDTFMRSAYVVFDQDNMQVGLAPYANCGENEQTIPAGGVGNVQGKCDSSNSNSGNGGGGGSNSGSGNGGSGSGDKKDTATGLSATLAPLALLFWTLCISFMTM
ncbi:candidapepsin-1 [Apiospora phragmitis]|uniref:Candidapepsin-1 n=1 Tax=Apiospora phragmitis TaxID=2905665 RepID=A0ABR1VQW6_9PEZI